MAASSRSPTPLTSARDQAAHTEQRRSSMKKTKSTGSNRLLIDPCASGLMGFTSKQWAQILPKLFSRLIAATKLVRNILVAHEIRRHERRSSKQGGSTCYEPWQYKGQKPQSRTNNSKPSLWCSEKEKIRYSVKRKQQSQTANAFKMAESWKQWYRPVSSALRRLRQEDPEFEPVLDTEQVLNQQSKLRLCGHRLKRWQTEPSMAERIQGAAHLTKLILKPSENTNKHYQSLLYPWKLFSGLQRCFIITKHPFSKLK